MRIRLNIKNRLMSYFGIALVISLVISAVVSSQLYRSAIEKKTMNYLRVVVDETANKLGIILNEKKRQLESIAAIPEIVDKDIGTEVKKSILEYLYTLFEFEDIAFIDIKGNTYSVNGMIEHMVDALFDSDNLGSEISLSSFIQIEEESVFTIKIPVRGPEKQIIGVLVGMNNMECLSKQIITSGIVDEYMLLDDTGRIIAHSDSNILNYQMPMENMPYYSEYEEVYEVYQEMITGSSGVRLCKKPETGEGNYLGYAPITMGWSIALIKNRNNVLDAVGLFDIKITLITLGIMIVSLAVVYYMIKRFAKKLTKLIHCLNEISAGEMGYQIPEDLLWLTDEIGEGARAIEAMQQGISEMLETLKGCTDYMNEQMEELTGDVKQSLREMLVSEEFYTLNQESKEDIVSRIESLSKIGRMISREKYLVCTNQNVRQHAKKHTK